MKTLIDIAYKRHGITTQKLADALKMSPRNVQRIGRCTPLTVAQAIKISEFFEQETGQKLMPWEYSEELKGLRDLITKG